MLTDEDEPNTEDEDESIRKAKARLKKYKVLEMPDTAKAEYLTRTFDERDILHMYMWTTQKRIRRFHTTVEHGTWASTTAVGCSVLSTTEIQ